MSSIPLTKRNHVGITSWISSVINTRLIYRLILVFLSGSNKSNGAWVGTNKRFVNSNVPSDLLCKVRKGSSKVAKFEL